ncbi:hypothetical protein NA57DRAFT_72500 [Rhizodiscina lignyota]|uniref:Ubiquitin-like protease family profile domain-containing protein n=1 Tax=Rhizodiscina lignyota TaxID=1504668 RepID=A0A9P4MAR5_9PEZI|nr:hypothetical protein NA57DRAFT_72500 [Rhizodiscina lignyota]
MAPKKAAEKRKSTEDAPGHVEKKSKSVTPPLAPQSDRVLRSSSRKAEKEKSEKEKAKTKDSKTPAKTAKKKASGVAKAQADKSEEVATTTPSEDESSAVTDKRKKALEILFKGALQEIIDESKNVDQPAPESCSDLVSTGQELLKEVLKKELTAAIEELRAIEAKADEEPKKAEEGEEQDDDPSHAESDSTPDWADPDAMLEHLKRLLNDVDELFPIDDDEGSPHKVEWDRYMNPTDTFLSIACVTEAIEELQQKSANKSIISLISESALYVARVTRQEPDFGKESWKPSLGVLNNRAARPRRTLYLPWLWHSYHEDAKAAEKISGEDFQKSMEKADRTGHWLLCVVEIAKAVDGAPNLLELPQICWYDSMPGFLAGHRKAIERQAVEVTIALQWHGGHSTYRPGDAPFLPTIDKACCTQAGGVECGMHVILNAWSHALDLELHPEFEPDKTFYQGAQEVVNGALAGRVNWEIVYSFLAGTGYVVATAGAVPESRRLARSVKMDGEETLQQRYEDALMAEDIQRSFTM